jgi:hypothetical protein
MSRIALIIVSVFVLAVAAGCLQVQPPPTPPPTTISSWGPLGGFTMSSGANCAGRATLGDTPTVVSDACFTDTDNIVLCTDTTSASGVRCTPAAGSLTIAGAAGDTIAYARVR